MAVVGIDFGNHNCYISVARQGGIETIANDYSLRETPSCVAFSDRQRILGVGAKNQCLTNVKRTVFWFKPLLGRQFKDAHVQTALASLPFRVSADKDGGILIHVQDQAYSPQQICAMLFTKLKETAEAALQTKVKDVVISCPAYFTDCERRALLDAAAIADLNVLKLMNDTTATALAYGIYKQDLPPPEEKARNVIFVDCGHMGIQVAASSFNKGKLVMKACAFDRHTGGKVFDEVMADYFAKDFQSKHKMDPKSNPRVYLKLITELEKVKKQMSANTNNLPLNIECFMDEKDLNGHIDRAKFEEMAAPILAQIEKVFQQCLALSEWKLEDIHSVEVVGGSTRVPAIKMAVEKVFGKTASTTLNSDEAVSRGCALQCAILSPTFKVREFSVTDIQPYPIKLTWKSGTEDEQMLLFPKFHQVPFSKMLTFYRTESFALQAWYDESEKELPLDSPYIGTFEIGEVPARPDGSSQKVKVRARINLHGVFTVASASFITKHEVEDDVPMDVDEATAAAATAPTEEQPAGGEPASPSIPAEGEAPNEAANATKAEKKKKVVTKTVDLPVTCVVVGSMPKDKVTRLAEFEDSLNKQDKRESERLTAKNSVEEYIYDIREKIHDSLAEYVTEESKAQYSASLERIETWLYEDGEDVDRNQYVEKLKELKVVGEAAKKRKSEFECRKKAIEALGHSLQMASKILEQFQSGDEQYNHLNVEDMKIVKKEMEEKEEWLNKSVACLEKSSKTTDPPILVSQFYSERDLFEALCKPIFNKPKPKVETPPPPPAAKSDAQSKKNDAPSMDTTTPEDKPNGTAPPNPAASGMEVD